MHGGSRQQGYTIVEVMIFLAVSGLMFVIAAGFVSGKQVNAEFKQGLNAMNTQITQITNDVGNGYYPSLSNFSCVASPAGGTPPQFGTATSVSQGGNKGCVFMGKVIQFAPQGTNNLGYNIYTLAGRQYKLDASDGNTPASFAEAKPTLVVGSPIDLTDRSKTQWNVRITKVITGSSDPRPNTQLSGIGFFSSFGTFDTGGTLNTGSQNTIVVPIYGTVNESESTMQNDIANSVIDTNIDASPNLIICIAGGNSRYGTVTIGSSNGQGQRLSTITNNSNSASTACQ